MRVFNIIILVATLLFISCKSSQPSSKIIERQVIVKDTIIKVQPPYTSGYGYGLPLIIEDRDTVIQYVKTAVNKDTVVRIKYSPIKNYFEYYFQPDSVGLTSKNTEITNMRTEVYQQKVSFGNKVKIAVIGGLIFIGLFILGKKLLQAYIKY